MAEILTPPPIQNAIAESPSGLTPRVWARWFDLLQQQVLAGGGGTEGPPGPQGEQGEPGPAGPPGPAGADGTDATLGPTLTTIEALTGTLDTLIYFTGTDVAALSALSALARTLLAGATTAAMQGTLGLGTAAVQDVTTGSFTITATGFTTTVTATASYIRVGNVVTLRIPTLSGTSNATTMTLTGMPATVLPAAGLTPFILFLGGNSGVNAIAYVQLATAAPWSTSLVTGPWTASGIKTMLHTVLTYPVA